MDCSFCLANESNPKMFSLLQKTEKSNTHNWETGANMSNICLKDYLRNELFNKIVNYEFNQLKNNDLNVSALNVLKQSLISVSFCTYTFQKVVFIHLVNYKTCWKKWIRIIKGATDFWVGHCCLPKYANNRGSSLWLIFKKEVSSEAYYERVWTMDSFVLVKGLSFRLTMCPPHHSFIFD